MFFIWLFLNTKIFQYGDFLKFSFIMHFIAKSGSYILVFNDLSIIRNLIIANLRLQSEFAHFCFVYNWMTSSGM